MLGDAWYACHSKQRHPCWLRLPQPAVAAIDGALGADEHRRLRAEGETHVEGSGVIACAGRGAQLCSAKIPSRLTFRQLLAHDRTLWHHERMVSLLKIASFLVEDAFRWVRPGSTDRWAPGALARAKSMLVGLHDECSPFDDAGGPAHGQRAGRRDGEHAGGQPDDAGGGQGRALADIPVASLHS